MSTDAPVKIATRYDYEQLQTNARLSEVYFDKKKDKSQTNQADMESADINRIMARYERTGNITDLLGNARKPVYGDFTGLRNFHEMQIAIAKAQQAFDQLPANVRGRFLNDPQQLIDFLGDSKNDKEAVDLGLKDGDVLLTALADDGKTRISPEERANLDKLKAEKAASAGTSADASATGGAAK